MFDKIETYERQRLNLIEGKNKKNGSGEIRRIRLTTLANKHDREEGRGRIRLTYARRGAMHRTISRPDWRNARNV